MNLQKSDNETQGEFLDRIRIDARRKRDAERVQRVIVNKTSISPSVLAAQIEAKALQEEARRVEEQKWADDQEKITRHIKAIELEEMQNKDSKKIALREEWKEQIKMKEEQKRKALEESRQIPVREIQGISSMQTFIGDDVQMASRKRLQTIQLKKWTDSHIAQKEMKKAKQMQEDRVYSDSLIALEAVREKVAKDEAQEKKTINREYAAYNAKLAMDKKNQNQRVDYVEPSNLSFALTPENSHISALGTHRKRKDHYSGMSKDEELAIRQEQQNQISAKLLQKEREGEERRKVAEEAKELSRITTEFERLEMEEKSKKAHELKSVLEIQRIEQHAQERKRKEDSVNKISAGFFSKFGTSAR